MRRLIKRDNMKLFKILSLLMLPIIASCQKENIKTDYKTEFETVTENIEFGSDGGSYTVDIPFDNCYLHFVRNNDSVLFFYIMENDYSQLDSIIESRSIIVEPKEVNPAKGFNYLEWDWFSVNLNDNKALISVKENNTHAERIAQIILPNRSFERLEITIDQEK